MIYIVFGTQDLMIKKRTNKIVKERLDEPDAFNCVQFNLNEQLVQDLVYEATLLPMGDSRKVVIGYNASFLLSEKGKIKNSEHDFAELEEYIKHQNEICDVILTVNGNKLDKKNALVEALLAVSQVYEVVNPDKGQWLQYIDTLMNKMHVVIENDAKIELLKRTGENAYAIDNECEKLALYATHIKKRDVETLVTPPLEENVFLILDALIKNNKKLALGVYRDLLVKNEEPVRLIGLLGTQLRTQADIYLLSAAGMNKMDIAETLKIHDFRVQLALANRTYITSQGILQELENLYQLDLAIKSGQVDRFYGFEMFLINFNRSK